MLHAIHIILLNRVVMENSQGGTLDTGKIPAIFGFILAVTLLIPIACAILNIFNAKINVESIIVGSLLLAIFVCLIAIIWGI